jgi:hypothetical protein
MRTSDSLVPWWTSLTSRLPRRAPGRRPVRRRGCRRLPVAPPAGSAARPPPPLSWRSAVRSWGGLVPVSGGRRLIGLRGVDVRLYVRRRLKRQGSSGQEGVKISIIGLLDVMQHGWSIPRRLSGRFSWIRCPGLRYVLVNPLAC